MRTIVFRVLAVAWMCVIFGYSAQPASVSTEKSWAVGRFIGRVMVPGFEERSEAEQDEFAEMVDFPVRKAAHALEYAVLGVLVYLAAGVPTEDEGHKWWRGILVAIGICVIYAISDEVHQRFVPGRACQVRDVLIDSAGSVVGVLIGSIKKQ